ncbi:MAG TPA: hypothetical protein VE987_23025 [Polyangiaceae bacterium]|nr:hypothetical protein [Polyangiaceae bacterium]
MPHLPPSARVAILSFHSHGDRSFLDDRELALVSGDLRHAGIDNDLIVTVLDPSAVGGGPIERRLVETLRGYDCVLFERVWSRALIAWIREQLREKPFVCWQGEHALDDPPADFITEWESRRNIPLLFAWLRGEADAPPPGVHVRMEDGAWAAPIRVTRPDETKPLVYAPNLRPVVINPEALPAQRTFSITGNTGCPFQLDARENPLYVGIRIPSEELGRGCAFCTTGNKYLARPNVETAASVLEQIRYVRGAAPELSLLVLKDQNPFGYLTEVVEQCAAEHVGGFTLLLETRADWFMRNAKRFERALEVALASDMRLAPFLVGVENFSQPELDRFNKGTTAEANVEFLDALWRWKQQYGDALELGHTSFGFILFTPWTSMADLEANLAGIRRTKFDAFRGSLLLSRARLYPDTALYYLARRDGLLAEEFRENEDTSRRYGYYPAAPWRFLHEDVAHFNALAIRLTEMTGSKDQVALFAHLLDAFREARDFREVTAEAVLARYKNGARSTPAPSAKAANGSRAASAPPAMRQRFARLVQPLPLESTFGEGWRFADLVASPGRLQVRLEHAREVPVVVELVPRGQGPCHERSRHYDIRYLGSEVGPAQLAAVDLVAGAIARNDR